MVNTVLKPIKAPLGCFGVEYDASCNTCQTCDHVKGCRDLMGDRLKRVTLDRVKFSFVPNGFHYRTMKVTETERDLEAVYAQTYTQVFATEPTSKVGWNGPQLIRLAAEAQCSVKMFMFACMFGHFQISPTKPFSPGQLVDNQALFRVNTYANACRSKFATFNIRALDRLANDNSEAYDLNLRMQRSEISAGRWIIKYKLYNEGQPACPMLAELEDELDPNWLAIEPAYSETLLAYSRREDDGTHAETRSLALEVYKRIKKHRHEALSNFLAREQAMPQAIELVLAEMNFDPRDFEIINDLVTDATRFWSRLAMAIQHFECVKLVHSGSGIYA